MPEADDDIPAEFKLASMGPSVQGKHAEAYRRHVRMVQLNDDLVGFYPTEASIVAALRRHAIEHPEAAGDLDHASARRPG